MRVHWIIIFLVGVMILGTLAFSELYAAAQSSGAKLTIFTSDKTVPVGGEFSLWGKLHDRNLVPIRNANIVIWENDGGKNSHVAETRTNYKGEYRVTVTAQYWDGPGNTVELLAYSGTGSVKSTIITVNVVAQQICGVNEVRDVKGKCVSAFKDPPKTTTKLTLKARDGLTEGSVQVFPKFETSSGQKLLTKSIKIYVDGKLIQKVSANNWSKDVNLGIGSHKINAYYVSSQTSKYLDSSGTVNFVITTKPSTSTTKPSTSTASSSIHSSYQNLAASLTSSIKAAENSLSGISFDHPEAKQKLENAWDIRWKATTASYKVNEIWKNSERDLKNRAYQQSYDKMLGLNLEADSVKNYLNAIHKEITEAKKIEDSFQKKNRSCFLFWCSEPKNQYPGLETRIRDLQSQISKIDINKESFESESHKLIVAQQQEAIGIQQIELEKKEKEMQQQQIRAENERLRLEEEKRQQQIRAENERLRLEEEKRQQQIQAEQVLQRLAEQKRLDDAKDQIRLQAKSSPLIKGLIDGELSFYVQPLPSYASQNVRVNVESLASWMDGTYIQGVKLKRVYSWTPDLSINWVKDYQEEAIGRQVGSHLIVGLGTGNCLGDWKPFDGQTVYRIMLHEVGHAMGYTHVSDRNNILYEGGTGTKFEYEYDEIITLSDGYKKSISFCNSRSVYFTTERLSSAGGYNVYVVGSGVNHWDVINRKAAFYLGCSAYENTMQSFSNTCNVEYGSYLVLYNPSSFGTGSDSIIKVKIVNTTPARDLDLAFDSDSMYWSKEYLSYVRDLFR